MSNASDNNDDLEVYIYRGNEGEEVPFTVEKLIVEEGVQLLPIKLCDEFQYLQKVTLPNNGGLLRIGHEAFFGCEALVEIRNGNTLKYIDSAAFKECSRLVKVDFVNSTSAACQLTTIGINAFSGCPSLLRIKLPSSVTDIGQSVFFQCHGLKEANLSNSCVVLIPDGAFYDCYSLQAVSLPKTVERISDYAFAGCESLVTVVTAHPGDSQSIKLGKASFRDCTLLLNLVLPKDSTATPDSFQGANSFSLHYGEHCSLILAGLINRFEEFPIHQLCYHQSETAAQELRHLLGDQQEEKPLVDQFGVTPFHVFFSTIEPNMELLKVLLKSLPTQVGNWKDSNDKRPLDYLMNNWTEGTSNLVQMTLQKWMTDRVARWDATSWAEAMQRKVQAIVGEEDGRRRVSLCDEAYSALEHYADMQATSILEMALWKWKLTKSEWTNGRQQASGREECRCLSGSDVVVPAVATFFLRSPSSHDEESSGVQADSLGDY